MADQLKIPFSVYDFFGYLAAGTILCMGVDYSVDGQWLLRQNQPIFHTFFWVIAAYIIGHINANLSAWLLERHVVGNGLKRPNENLFQTTSPKVLRFIFPGYYTVLPAALRERILTVARNHGVTGIGEVLFHHARTVAKKDPVTWSRLDTFLERYGFCRNISSALLLLALVLGIQCWRLDRPTLGYLSVVALATAVGMFYRYLKFFRQYSYEVFTVYPDLAKD